MHPRGAAFSCFRAMALLALRRGNDDACVKPAGTGLRSHHLYGSRDDWRIHKLVLIVHAHGAAAMRLAAVT